MPNTKLFDTPNLDGLSVDPADYLEAENVLRELMKYCRHKRMSMELRASGDIENAKVCEFLADAIYLKLPDWAKW